MNVNWSRWKLTLILLVAGGALFATSTLVSMWHRRLVFPIELHSGVVKSGTLNADYTGTYLIDLVVERNLPFKQLTCLLGVNPGPESFCAGTQSPVLIRWRVLSAKETIAEGNSDTQHDGAWGDAIGRTIGSFQAEAGRQYAIEVEPLRDGSVLDKASPKISVAPHPIVLKGFETISQVFQYLGLIMSAVGSITLLNTAVRSAGGR